MESQLLVLNNFVSAVPGMIVWIMALVSSIILSRRGGGKLEHFLIAGSSLMLVSILLSVPVPVIAHYLAQSSLSNARAAAVISVINLFLGLIKLAGVICLFYAIWNKFNERYKITTINRET